MKEGRIIYSRGKKLLLLPYQQAEADFKSIFDRKNAPLRDLEVGRLRLTSKNKPYLANSGNKETIIYILIGKCEIEIKGKFGKRVFRNIGERQDVFGGLPSACLIPPNSSYQIKAITKTVDAVIASTVLIERENYSPFIVRPDDVDVYFIGEANYKREVRVVIGGEGPSKRLKVGETINPRGCWSSWPRHSFDCHSELASQFEEVFIYFTKPKDGFALQMTKGLFCTKEEIDDVWVIKNGDSAILPLGDHPVVAGPDTILLYVWFYISPISKKYPKWAEDIGEYAR